MEYEGTYLGRLPLDVLGYIFDIVNSFLGPATTIQKYWRGRSQRRRRSTRQLEEMMLTERIYRARWPHVDRSGDLSRNRRFLDRALRAEGIR
mgnify:CR=1 FL=1